MNSRLKSDILKELSPSASHRRLAQRQRITSKKKVSQSKRNQLRVENLYEPTDSQNKEPNVYSNIQIVRKVATFLQKVKVRIIKTKKKLDPLEALYLESEDIQEQSTQYLLNWDNPMLIAFEGAFMTILMMTFWLTTYELVLGRFTQGQMIYKLALSFYVLSIVLLLNTELKTEKLEIISKRWLIWKNYFWSDFIYDAIAIVALFFIILKIQQIFFPERIIFLVSFATISRTIKKVEDHLAVSNYLQSIIGISKLILRILSFLHMLALFLNGISQIQKQRGVSITWVQFNQLEGRPPFQMYIHGYYWASTIMSTVGFGQIVPGSTIIYNKDVYQRGIVSFVELFCCLFFGYCVNYIGQLIGVIGESRNIYEKDIRRLNKYLKTTKIPDKVKDKVKEHFYNKYMNQEVYDAVSEQYLFNKMSEPLKREIKQKNNIYIADKSKYLRMFSEESRKKLSLIMTKKVYAPEETLFDQDTEELKLYLIDQGEVSEYCFDTANSNGKSIAKYDQEDNTIGWSNMITGYKYRSLTKARTYTLMYEISQEDFISILKENQKDFLKFHEIREKILQRKIAFKKDCFVCQKMTHNVVQCPKIHYTPKPPQLAIAFYNNCFNQITNKRNSNFIRKTYFEPFIIEERDNETEIAQSNEDFIQVSVTSRLQPNMGVIRHSLQNNKINIFQKELAVLLENKIASITRVSGINNKKQINKRQSLQQLSQNQANDNSIKSGQQQLIVRSPKRSRLPKSGKSISNYKNKLTESTIHSQLNNTLRPTENEQNELIIDSVMLEEDANFFPKNNISAIIEKISSSQKSQQKVQPFPKIKLFESQSAASSASDEVRLNTLEGLRKVNKKQRKSAFFVNTQK